MKGVLMGIVLFIAFGLPAHAGNFGEQQIVELQTWSVQCPAQSPCRDDTAALISRIRALTDRVAVYLKHPTQQEYDAIQKDGAALADDIDHWSKRYHIVSTKIVSERTN